MSIKAYLKKQKNSFHSWCTHTAFRGIGRDCPVCEKSSRRFLAFGAPKREDAKCPMCWCLERHRLLILYLRISTSFFSAPPEKMLHYAPEAQLSRMFRGLIREGYTTTDLMDPSVDVLADITQLPFSNGSFDFIVCNHVLEHIADDYKAMAENFRVLKPGGKAIFMVPLYNEPTIEDPSEADPKERLRRFAQEDHVRKYGPDIAQRLCDAGFSVDAIYKEDFLTEDQCDRYGLKHSVGRHSSAPHCFRDCIFWCQK